MIVAWGLLQVFQSLLRHLQCYLLNTYYIYNYNTFYILSSTIATIQVHVRSDWTGWRYFWWFSTTTLSPVCRAEQQPHIFPGRRIGWPGCGAFGGGLESHSHLAALQQLHCCDVAGTLSRIKVTNQSFEDTDASLDMIETKTSSYFVTFHSPKGLPKSHNRWTFSTY